MGEELGSNVRLLYLTKRSKHNSISLFMHVDNIDVMGDFISTKISKIQDVDGVWVFNMINPKFFPIPKGTTPNLTRYTLTIRAYPKHLQDIYETLCNYKPRVDFVVTYVANTFHLFGDSVMMSFLAKDDEAVKEFVDNEVKTLSGVLQTNTFIIEKTHRLIPREEWQNYAHIYPGP